MYIDNENRKAKIGRINVSVRGNSVKIRFTYPKGCREDLKVATNTNEGWIRAIFDLLNIGTDVMPASSATKEAANKPIGQGTLKANTRLTWKSSIAHELVGHREAALVGKTQLKEPLEEAQASIRAARFAPSLSSTERYTLLRDGITRLYKADIKIRQVKNILHIINR